MTATAVIVAAGKGERFGDSGKVLANLLDRPVLAWTLDAFEKAASISEIVVVVGEHTRAPIVEMMYTGSWRKISEVVVGGETRQESTAHGVQAVESHAEIIVVHDAARPLILSEQIEQCIQAAREHGGAILAAPLTDTVKRVQDGIIAETIDRSTLWGAQTPQVFQADLMRQMIEFSQTTIGPVTDEASLSEGLGKPVHIVAGDSINLKITHPSDLLIAEALLRARKEAEL